MIGEMNQPRRSTKGPTFILKINRPLVDGDLPIAMNRDKSVVRELPARSPILAMLGRDRSIYVKACLGPDGRSIEIGEKVEGQTW